MQRHDHMPIAASGLLAAAPAVVLAAPPLPMFAPADQAAHLPHAAGAVRRLAGEIGYLDPNGLSARDIDDAFAGLADARALILDLRTHDGGEADARLLGHLSWRPIPMATIRRSRDGVALTRWSGRAAPAPDGPLFPDKPVFVLIDRRSPLTAQALAYDLRMAGRAAVIGEADRGESDALTLAHRRALSCSGRAA